MRRRGACAPSRCGARRRCERCRPERGARGASECAREKEEDEDDRTSPQELGCSFRTALLTAKLACARRQGVGLPPRRKIRLWPITASASKGCHSIANSGHSMVCEGNIAHANRKCIDRIPNAIINMLMINSASNEFVHVTPSTFALLVRMLP